MKYTFYEDPGHGWLAVSLHELHELKIIDKISGCSYVSPDRQTVYLEEDCDLSTFLVAKIYDYVPKDWKDAMIKLNREDAQKWYEANVEEKYQENTFIRNLDSYALKAA